MISIVVDPGFPSSKGQGDAQLLFGQFSRKVHENEQLGKEVFHYAPA